MSLAQSPARTPRWSLYPQDEDEQSPVLPCFLISIWDVNLRQISIYIQIICLQCCNKTLVTWSLLLKVSHFDQSSNSPLRCEETGPTPLPKTELVSFFLLRLITMVYEYGGLPHWGLRVQTLCFPCFFMVKGLLSEFQCFRWWLCSKWSLPQASTMLLQLGLGVDV